MTTEKKISTNIKKKEKLIRKIQLFFEDSALTHYNLKDGNEEAESFVLEEDGLWDTEVIAISNEGVETDGYGFKSFEDLSIGDLEHIVENVIEPIKTDEDKTMDKCRDNNY